MTPAPAPSRPCPSRPGAGGPAGSGPTRPRPPTAARPAPHGGPPHRARPRRRARLGPGPVRLRVAPRALRQRGGRRPAGRCGPTRASSPTTTSTWPRTSDRAATSSARSSPATADAMPWYLPAPELATTSCRGRSSSRRTSAAGAGSSPTTPGRARSSTGGRPGRPTGIAGRSIEHVDARSLPASWLDEDPGLARRAPATGDDRGRARRPEPPSYPYGPFGPRPITWPATVVIPLVDEGDGGRGTDRVVDRHPRRRRRGPGRRHRHRAGGRVPRRRRSTGAERARRRRDLHPRRQPPHPRVARQLRPAGRPRGALRRRRPPRPRAPRADSTPWRARRRSAAPTRCSSEVWAVGRRTVSICSIDSYLDCPTREQRAWTGDSVVHQMVDLTTNDGLVAGPLAPAAGRLAARPTACSRWRAPATPSTSTSPSSRTGPCTGSTRCGTSTATSATARRSGGCCPSSRACCAGSSRSATTTACPPTSTPG